MITSNWSNPQILWSANFSIEEPSIKYTKTVLLKSWHHTVYMHMYGQPTPRVHELCAVTFHFSLRDSRQQKGQDCLSIHSSEANVQCSVSKCQADPGHTSREMPQGTYKCTHQKKGHCG